jgi:hypothetical protein
VGRYKGRDDFLAVIIGVRAHIENAEDDLYVAGFKLGNKGLKLTACPGLPLALRVSRMPVVGAVAGGEHVIFVFMCVYEVDMGKEQGNALGLVVQAREERPDAVVGGVDVEAYKLYPMPIFLCFFHFFTCKSAFSSLRISSS